jgi:hypothetical protein
VSIWDIDAVEPVLLDRIPAASDRISDIVWIDQERMAAVLVGLGSPEWQVLDLSTGSVVATALDGLVRGFTEQECDTYVIDPCPSLDEMRSR